MKACIFLEFLEPGSFQNILPKQATYFRYIRGVLLIYRRDTDLHDLVVKLNKVKHIIETTCEIKTKQYFTFLRLKQT